MRRAWDHGEPHRSDLGGYFKRCELLRHPSIRLSHPGGRLAKHLAAGLPNAARWRQVWPVFLIATLLLICPPHRMLAQGSPALRGALAGRNLATRTNTAQAVLHITATIVPAVVAPQSGAEKSSPKDLFINLPSQQLEMDVTSEWHRVPDQAGAALKTTTVVRR